MSGNQRYLQNPPGTESYFLDEAWLHQGRSTGDYFTSWGYLPVNAHYSVEALFKATGMALAAACRSGAGGEAGISIRGRL